MLAIGTVVWLRPWLLLQTAAQSSLRERSMPARRWLLGAVVLIGALMGVGFLVALLWLVFRMVLGGPHDAGTLANIFKYGATSLIAGAVIPPSRLMPAHSWGLRCGPQRRKRTGFPSGCRLRMKRRTSSSYPMPVPIPVGSS